MEQLTLILNDFNAFLKPNSRGTWLHLKKSMSYFDKKKSEREGAFFSTFVNSDVQLIKSLEGVLKNLNIPEHQWGRYTRCNVSVYAVMVELSKRSDLDFESKEKLKKFRDLIHKKMKNFLV